MKEPRYKEIFIFIAGSTPQVVTETIYALAKKKPATHPDELYIITTSKGREMAEDALLRRGVLKMLVDEYGLPRVPLKESSFIVPKDPSGRSLDDIRNEAENEAMGDLITTFIREKAKDLSTRLHCSLAGGRKTMSFYVGAALQLFGRPWDKLYHVLVTPEFESNPEFYYKPKKNHTISFQGKKLNTRDAEITLAELPFIRLRNKLFPDVNAGFRELVKEGQRDIDMASQYPDLRVNLAERTVYIGPKAVRLMPVNLMIYMAYLRHKLSRCRYSERPYCIDCTDCYPSLIDLSTRAALEEMVKDYRQICPSKADDLLHKYKNGLTLDVIRQAISKVRKAMRDALGDEALVPYYAITTSLRGYGSTRHGVRTEKTKIKIM